jgi:hypothetical protein
MNQVPEKLYFGQWPYIIKIYPVNAIWLPTKFATVSQNLSECFFTISDFRLVVVKSSLCGGMKIDQFTRAAYLSDKFIYPALVLFEESNCIDWINFYYIRSLFAVAFSWPVWTSIDTTAKLSENSWNKRRSKRFQRDVSAYTVTVSVCCSTGIRYQKSYILVSDRI